MLALSAAVSQRPSGAVDRLGTAACTPHDSLMKRCEVECGPFSSPPSLQSPPRRLGSSRKSSASASTSRRVTSSCAQTCRVRPKPGRVVTCCLSECGPSRHAVVHPSPSHLICLCHLQGQPPIKQRPGSCQIHPQIHSGSSSRHCLTTSTPASAPTWRALAARPRLR